MTRALFIGRFQPFHKGHYNAVEDALEQYDLVIGIGSAETSHTMNNPLTFEERKQVIQSCFPNVPIRGIPDRPDNDDWLDWIAAEFAFDTGISGNDLVQRLFRSRDWPIEDPNYLEPDRFSGTHIRENIRSGEDWRHLVPDCSIEQLEAIGFIERVRETAENS